MRSAFLWFLALLLMPSLILAQKGYSPPPSDMPKHGDYVNYSHNGGYHSGLVVGTEHQVYRGHPLHVAPMDWNGNVDHGRLVQMHPGHPTTTGHSDVGLACDIQRTHLWQDPTISHVSRRRVYSLIV
ncbi:hypothetical protein JOM56_010408 [Amanita muscaria]